MAALKMIRNSDGSVNWAAMQAQEEANKSPFTDDKVLTASEAVFTASGKSLLSSEDFVSAVRSAVIPVGMTLTEKQSAAFTAQITRVRLAHSAGNTEGNTELFGSKRGVRGGITWLATYVEVKSEDEIRADFKAAKKLAREVYDAAIKAAEAKRDSDLRALVAIRRGDKPGLNS